MKIMNGADLNGQKITNLADPSASMDAVNLQYVQNLLRGLQWKAPVRASSTANVTLSAPGATLDGVTLATNDRLLLKNQTAGAENGIWVWTGSGTPLTRSLDADTNGELAPGTAVSVTEGTVNGDKTFIIISDVTIIIGTTSQTWGQLGGGTAYLAGNGLTLGGTTFTVLAVGGGGILVAAGGISLDTSVAVRKYSSNIGNGSLTSIAVTHGLGSKDVHVQLQEVSTSARVETDWVATDINTVTFTFPTAPTTAQFRATIHV